jgi:hypothetical protein
MQGEDTMPMSAPTRRTLEVEYRQCEASCMAPICPPSAISDTITLDPDLKKS